MLSGKSRRRGVGADELERLDATALAELVARREVTPEELATRAVARLEAVQPALNAVVHRFDVERSLAEMPEDGPFRGVPFLFKDELEVAGRPMTLGSRLLAGYRSSTTHPLARRMLDAGLVPLGRTNMSEVGLLPTTEPHAYGPTQNPWRLGASPGGSSGGSAAAVAAGVVPLASAGDGGGSIRIPASACGLVGLKPSRGRQPMGVDDPPQGFVVHHVVTRSVRDAAALLDATAGGHAGRWSLPRPREPFRDSVERDPEPLRVAMTLSGFAGERIDPEVREVVARTARRLEALGHRVEEVDAPIEPAPFAQAFRMLWCAAAGVFLRIAEREAPLPDWVRPLTRRPGVFRALTALPLRGGPVVEPLTRRLAGLEARLRPSDLWLAQLAMEEDAERLRGFFGDHDLWLTPTLTRPPPKVGELDLDASDDEVERQLFGLVGFTPVANVTGLPALSVPAGQSSEGLPIGAHLLAPMAREDRLLAIAAQLERAHPWPLLAPLAPTPASGGAGPAPGGAGGLA
ncbi:MAG: amidase [Sandaracinaceae bacterium]